MASPVRHAIKIIRQRFSFIIFTPSASRVRLRRVRSSSRSLARSLARARPIASIRIPPTRHRSSPSSTELGHTTHRFASVERRASSSPFFARWSCAISTPSRSRSSSRARDSRSIVTSTTTRRDVGRRVDARVFTRRSFGVTSSTTSSTPRARRRRDHADQVGCVCVGGGRFLSRDSTLVRTCDTSTSAGGGGVFFES